MKPRDYEKIDWLNFVELEKSSPSGLVWKHNRKQAGSKNYKKNGKPSGWRLELNNVGYYCHRIIAVLIYKENDRQGYWVVNHIDCNPFNNAFSNLEVCACDSNNRRIGAHVDDILFPNNTSGITGVGLNMISNSWYFIANWYDPTDGKQRRRSFSVKKFGKSLALKMAISCREFAVGLVSSNLSEYKKTVEFTEHLPFEIRRKSLFIRDSENEWVRICIVEKDELINLLKKLETEESREFVRSAISEELQYREFYGK